MCKSVFICRTCDVVFRECLRTERFRGDGGRGSPAARVREARAKMVFLVTYCSIPVCQEGLRVYSV